LFLAFGPPQSLSADENEATSLVISWTVPSPSGNAQSVAQYVIKWDPRSNDGTNEIITSANVTTTTINQLASNTNYNISVAARSIADDDATTGAFRYDETFTSEQIHLLVSLLF